MAEPTKPLIVSTREARRLLADMGKNKFWRLAKEGEFDLVGTRAKRFVTMASLEAYLQRLREAAR